MARGELYRFNTLGLILCALHIRWQRRRHYFCSQLVSEVLEKSGAMTLPKDSTLMHPNDYTQLPQRKAMELGEAPSAVSVYLGLMLGLAKAGARKIF